MNNTSLVNTTTNKTDGEESDLDGRNNCPFEMPTETDKWLKTSFCILVFAISLIANTFIISVVTRKRKIRTVTNCLVANMACSDLLIGLINMPELIKEEVTGSYAFPVGGAIGSFFCKVTVLSQDVSSFCSILTLVAIAVERFLAICCPYKKFITLFNVKYIISATWVIAFLVSSPLLYANKIQNYEGEIYCQEDWKPAFDTQTASRTYTITTFVLLYVLPLCLICVLYSGVVYRLWHRNVPGDHRTAASRRQRSKSKKRVLKMLIIIVVAFALCWLPYHIYFFLDNYFFIICQDPWNLYFYGKFIAYTNSAVNPCIFITFDRGMRKYLSTHIHPCCDVLSNSAAAHIPRVTSGFYSSQTEPDNTNTAGVKLTMFGRRKSKLESYDNNIFPNLEIDVGRLNGAFHNGDVTTDNGSVPRERTVSFAVESD